MMNKIDSALYEDVYKRMKNAVRDSKLKAAEKEDKAGNISPRNVRGAVWKLNNPISSPREDPRTRNRKL